MRRIRLSSVPACNLRSCHYPDHVAPNVSRGWQRCAISIAVVVTWMSGVIGALGWGPHPTITQAALDTLGTDHPLVRLLGQHAIRLTNYCWMADYKRLPFRDSDADFHADDYLLFPGMPSHLDHLCPEVKRTYAPYLQRALQAMRTESPANAARWIGSLLHFVEDTGSPPHAAEIRGPTHIKMENWVDATQIRLGDYRPRSLGRTDEEVAAGFARRMEELIAYSRPRGQRLMTPVLLGNRKAVEPVALECAIETSRVVADLLNSIGRLLEPEASPGAVLRGLVRSTPFPRYEKAPARVLVRGTPFATLADAGGRFEFRDLPAGRHELTVMQSGHETTNLWVVLGPGQPVEVTVALTPGSLIRNCDFNVHWLRPDAPDCWYRTGGGWEGEVLALKVGRGYRLRVEFEPGTRGDVLLRWSRHLEYELPQNVALPRIEARPIRPESPELKFAATESMALLQITVRGGTPSQVCRRIDLVLDDGPEGSAGTP